MIKRMALSPTYFKTLVSFIAVFFVMAYAFADDGVVAPQDFLAQILDAVRAMGGVSKLAVVASVITLVISSMKVSFLNSLVWDRLGSAKVLVAPILSIVAGVIVSIAGGAKFSLPMVVAYLGSSVGSVFLHQLLDGLKEAPFVGAPIKSVIAWISKVLGGDAPKPLAVK